MFAFWMLNKPMTFGNVSLSLFDSLSLADIPFLLILPVNHHELLSAFVKGVVFLMQDNLVVLKYFLAQDKPYTFEVLK